LGSELAKAQLTALKLQLNPHFLFNTLNSISTLIHSDPRAADSMVVRLGALLRMTLAAGDEQEVALANELELVRAYLQIELTRFGDRLRIVDDTEPAALEAAVPAMLLQPLVENAIRHGAVAGRPTELRIGARISGDRLELVVEDDGRGASGEGASGGGLGLANTRARLQALYGDDHQLTAANRPSGGFRCRILIPFRPVPTSASQGASE
jgi:LytS/YehU family sensor histidine kinase